MAVAADEGTKHRLCLKKMTEKQLIIAIGELRNMEI